MPIYEYRCTDCGETFARLQRVGASADDVRCPACGSAVVERLLSAFASTSSTSGTSTASPKGCGSGGFT
jgi:putative FmdB family regulatory protein